MSAEREPTDQRTEQDQRETEATVGWVGPGTIPRRKYRVGGKAFQASRVHHMDISPDFLTPAQ